MNQRSRITLRPLSPADAADIERWPKYPQQFELLDYALRSGGWLDTFPESATTKRFGGWSRGTLVGFSLLTDITAQRAEFYVAVHPAHTGQGIGRQLTEETLRYAFTYLTLHTVYLKVREWHSRAVALYRGLGFVVSDHKEELVQGKPVAFQVMELRARDCRSGT